MLKKAVEDKNFSIKNLTKGKLPRLPFAKIKTCVLGKKYDLSLVFAGSALTKKLNHDYRGKMKPANVLSFPLSEASGEVFINLAQAKKEAGNFSESYRSFVGFLFIHALLHLKDMRHGIKMESEEKKIRNKFKVWDSRSF
jgi:rRNA maturation RNase YbeY